MNFLPKLNPNILIKKSFSFKPFYKINDKVFTSNIYLFFVLNMLDIISTIKALEFYYLRETNLIFSYFMNNSMLSFILVKSIMVLVIIGLYLFMYDTKFKSYTYYSLIIFNLLMLFVVINNCIWWCIACL